ncbi:GntR family transcriptional regulator [Oceanomicrobium pacificus]|uniref:UTRA domain-containing protein n=1 Tax=Oceanomicrobium pacificus TaxID=2692916 RepID=A0A6B0TZT8_9RHOB|nr:GntR family transcriptional regulator [Oceanomicrobium pacificus]MXU64401.1 UTRA domain-containing protein [Oceanomicrobium pacificus]
MPDLQTVDTSPDIEVRALDRKSAVPLYHQLFIDLRRQILDGRWKPGHPFPKDSDIEAAYDVSRITVRQAVSQLVDANLVLRFRGRGSFVSSLIRSDAPVNHRLVRDEIRALGMKPSHRNLGPIEIFEVSDLTAKQMHCEIGDEVQILQRLHLADDRPFCTESIMLLKDRYDGIFDRVVSGKEELTDAYKRFGVNVVKSEQTVNAMMPSEERREKLGMPDGVPALVVERIGFLDTNEPVDVRRLYYRGDRFSLRQEVLWPSPEDTRI